MDLKNYIDSLEWGGAKNLADKLGVSKSFLSQMASGASSISPKRCVEIEVATYGKVTRKDFRPSDWHKIWPELEII